AATSSSGGNSLRGNTPRCAVTSQASATTRNGKALRAMRRQRLSPCRAAVPAVRTYGDEAGARSAMAHDSAAAPSRTTGPRDASVAGARGRSEGRDECSRMRAARGAAWIYTRAAVTTASPMHGMTALDRLPKRVVAPLAITATLAAGVAGGFAARYVHLPLP